MRNLKKILALVLALVMTFSVMATANAFTDDANIDADYAEAVEVLAGLKVFEGYENGSFQPKGLITRAEVAAIIYRIVTGDVDDKQVGIYADYNVFSDVKSTSWYAGYVNYCANAEYILGYGNGNFGPNDKVTGYQALAMILRAVGYDKMNEFTGAAWQVQTAAVGKKLGVTDNVTAGTLGTAATREVVAEILFQTIAYVDQVDYTVAFGYSTRGNETIGEETFDLAETTGIDDWGRPCTIWYADNYSKGTNGKYDAKKETVYATIEEIPVAVYYVATSECDIAKDLDLDGKTNEVVVYTNGEDAKDNIDALNQKSKLGGQGTLLEIYDEEHIVIIDTYLAQVTKVIEEKTDKNGHVTREAATKLNVWYDDEDGDAMTVDGETGYAVDDYVLVYVNEEEDYVEIVDYAESMTGAQTAYTTKASHIVEGEEYADAAQFNHDEADDKTTNYTWFFDQYGNLIGSFEIATTYSYGTISSIYWRDSNDGENGYAQATITYIDGTSEAAKIYSIQKVGDEEATVLKSGDSTSSYDRGRVSETKQYNVDEFTNVALYKISSGSKGLVLTETTYLPDATTETGVPALTDEIDAGNATLFLVWDADDEEYETYTGIKNIPTYVAGDFWYVDTNNNDVVEYVFIIDPTAEDDEQTITYFWNEDLEVTTNLKNSKIVSYTIEGGYVDGEALEITTKDADIVKEIKDASCTLLILTETNGYITAVEAVTDNPVKVDSLSAYVVYAGAAYEAVLDETHDVLIDEFGYSYDVEEIEQIVCDEDLADAIDEDDNKDDPEYLYVVYKKGSSNTKIASMVYVSCTEGTLYEEPAEELTNNLYKVEVLGEEVEATGKGAGTEADPFTYVAYVCGNEVEGNSPRLSVVDNYAGAEMVLIATGTGKELDAAEGTVVDEGTVVSAATDWTVTSTVEDITTCYNITVVVLSHDAVVESKDDTKVAVNGTEITVYSVYAGETNLTESALIAALDIPETAEADYADGKLTVTAQCGDAVEYTVVFAESDTGDEQ